MHVQGHGSVGRDQVILVEIAQVISRLEKLLSLDQAALPLSFAGIHCLNVVASRGHEEI